MSRIKQVITTLEAERDEVRERLAWLDQQIDEFRADDQKAPAPGVTSPAPRSRRRATATRASSRRAAARKHKHDVHAEILEHLAGHPQSTAGDVAKGLNLDRTKVAAKLAQMHKAGEIEKAKRGYRLTR
jgi:hypothetical protein